MKTFNFRKLGILLVMMLVSGMVLVGSASAYETEGSSNNGYYDVWAGGSVIAGEAANYYGQTGTKNGATAGAIYVCAYIMDSSSELHWVDDGRTNTNFLEASEFFDHHAPISYPRVKVEMSGANPDDLKRYQYCNLY